MNHDLTIIMPTLNRLPKGWVKYHKKVLLEAAGDYPIITISKEPMDFGMNVIENGPETVANLYWKMLRGAKLAATPYVAMAEDDSLYTREHFQFRPPLDTFAYNMNRWIIFTWGQPFYFLKQSPANTFLIAPRELMVEALEERFKKYPDGTPEHIAGELGRQKSEKKLGLTLRGYMEFLTYDPVVSFNHDFSMDPLERSHKKRAWPIRAYDIPKWGRAEDLVKKFA